MADPTDPAAPAAPQTPAAPAKPAAAPSVIIPDEIRKAAEQGQAPVAIATKSMTEDVFENLRAIVREGAAQGMERIDEEPDPTKGMGRVDLVLGQLHIDQVDRYKVHYRLIDRVEDPVAQARMRGLMERRYVQKNRALTPSDVQFVRDVGESVGIKWAGVHRMLNGLFPTGTHG